MIRSGRILVLTLVFSACSAQVPAPALPENFDHPMVWSSVRYTVGEDPHAYGVKVELWKQNTETAGFLSEYVGPPADAPAGRLENIVLDGKTGSLSFVTKLSVGVVLSDDGKSWVPARNEYAFSGTVNEERLTGTLQRQSIQTDGKVVSEDEQIVLERDRTAERTPDIAYSDWLDAWERILQARGPRW